MALREILIWPDPRLKVKAKAVGKVDDTIRALCDDMADSMYDAAGVGLAAPQLGFPLNIIAMDVEQRAPKGEEAKPKGSGLFFLIDPILKLADGEFSYTEGCLSIPDEYEEVTRFGHIVVEYTDRDGRRKQRESTNNLLTVCVQHEMDHLQGKLFVDHLSALKRELIKRRMKKLKVQRQAELKGEATAL
jgi:peptide deformylase